MLDINFIIANEKGVKEAVKNKNRDPNLIDGAINIYYLLKKLRVEVDGLRAKRNELSKRRSLDKKVFEEAKQVKDLLKSKEADLDKFENDLKKLLLMIPNVY